MKKPLSEQEKIEIFELNKKGEKAVRIAEHLGRPYSTVANFINYKLEGYSTKVGERTENLPQVYELLLQGAMASRDLNYVREVINEFKIAKKSGKLNVNLEDLFIHGKEVVSGELEEIAINGGSHITQLRELLDLEEEYSMQKTQKNGNLGKNGYLDLTSQLVKGEIDGEIIYTEKQISECFGITKRNINKLEKNELMIPEGKRGDERIYSGGAVKGLINYFEEGKIQDAVNYGFEVVEIPIVDNTSHKVDEKLSVHQVDSVKKTKKVISRKNLSIQK